MNQLTKEKADAIRQEHPKAIFRNLDGLHVGLRPMSRQEFDALGKQTMEARDNKTNPMTPTRNMILQCCVHPTRQEMDTALDERPGIIGALAQELNKLAGAEVVAEELTF